MNKLRYQAESNWRAFPIHTESERFYQAASVLPVPQMHTHASVVSVNTEKKCLMSVNLERLLKTE